MTDRPRERPQEKEGVQKLKSLVRGFPGYERAETRADADKQIREHLVGLLDPMRAKLTGDFRKRLEDYSGTLKSAFDADRVLGDLTRARDDLRFADYGATGWLEAGEMAESELQVLYQHDVGFFAQLPDVDEAVEGLRDAGMAGFDEQLATAKEIVGRFQDAVDRRAEIIAELSS